MLSFLAAALLAGALAASAPAAQPACVPLGGNLTGTICTPPVRSGKHPAILLLGGSEGGNSLATLAPVFAARGFVAVSLAYFDAPGLPPSLENVPVETVGTALGVLAARTDVAANEIALFGVSKGGELALLAASLYPSVHAVVAGVPSPFAWQGIPRGAGGAASSWTHGARPLPFVPYTASMAHAFTVAFSQHKALELRPAYDDAMSDKGTIARAFFHLEQIRGPVLLLAGDDDRLWNSPAQCALALAYLSERHHPFNDAYVHYPDAGHLFLFATAQQPLLEADFMTNLSIAFGGTAAGNVAAANQAWPKIYDFLSAAFRAPPLPKI